MVYDVTSQESFDHVEEWLSEVNKYASEGTSKLLLGNKADLTDEKQVSTEHAQRFADKLGIRFLETSAKTAANVDAAFLTMAKELMSRTSKGPAQPDKKPVDLRPVTKEKKGCC